MSEGPVSTLSQTPRWSHLLKVLFPPEATILGSPNQSHQGIKKNPPQARTRSTHVKGSQRLALVFCSSQEGDCHHARFRGSFLPLQKAAFGLGHFCKMKQTWWSSPNSEIASAPKLLVLGNWQGYPLFSLRLGNSYPGSPLPKALSRTRLTKQQ